MENNEYYTRVIYNEKTKRNVTLIYPLVDDAKEAEAHNKKIAGKVFDILAMVKS